MPLGTAPEPLLFQPRQLQGCDFQSRFSLVATIVPKDVRQAEKNQKS